MSTTFIDTNTLPRVKAPQGEIRQVLSEEIVGAKNVDGALRWLDGETFDAVADNKYQLLYLMEGAATIVLEGKEYPVKKGWGVYLEPGETASIKADGQVKLFHLIVPIIPSN